MSTSGWWPVASGKGRSGTGGGPSGDFGGGNVPFGEAPSEALALGPAQFNGGDTPPRALGQGVTEVKAMRQGIRLGGRTSELCESADTFCR